jgi:hypothetical protein
MSSIKVVDANNEEAKEEEPAEEIEEQAEEPPAIENEVIEQVKEEPQEEAKEELKNNSKTERYRDKMITCPKCSKTMLLRSYRYKHEKNCQGKIENKPIKPQSKPKPKPQPKPPPEPAYYESSEEQPQQKTIKKKQPVVQPINHTTALAQHYQLLQQEMVKQKQERYKKLCMNMFSSKTKNINIK